MTVTINGTTGIAGVDGSAGTPAVQGGDTNTGMFFPAADTIAFAEGGAEIARFDSSGNLGIGTSSPTSYAGYASLALNNATNGGVYDILKNNIRVAAFFSSDVTTTLASITSIPLAFRTANTERMRIDSSGNLLVGTTSTNPVASRVTGTAITPTFITTVGATSGMAVGIKATSGTSINFYTDNGSAYVGAGTITSSGSTTGYNTSSDYRLKENVQPMTGALDRVAQLKPVTYLWKPDFAGTNPNGEGFIAHELAEVCPQAVYGEKDEVDDEGKPKYQGVDTSFLVATLTAAIQEQQTIITALTARIETLEAK